MFNYPTIKDLFIKYDIDYSKIKKYKPLIKIKDKYINDYSIECHGDDCNILVISSKTKFYCLNADNYFICDKCNYCYCYKCYNVCNNRKYYCEECDNHYSVAFIENYDINQLLQLKIKINTWNKYRWGGYKITEKDVINVIYDKLLKI